jgi:hypothetical protein
VTSPIRPQFTPPSASPAPRGATSNARAAFFQAALGQAGAPAAGVQAQAAVRPAETPRPVAQARPVQTPTAQAAPPERILRPGSLLDIKV